MISFHKQVIRYLAIVFLLSPSLLFSQNRSIVIDGQTREPLKDVLISFGTDDIHFTNKAGEFYINVSSDTVVLFVSHLGYQTKEIKNIGKKDIIIELFPNIKQLDEVVIGISNFDEKLKRESSSISLLLREDFSIGGNANISRIVNSIPGVYMHHGSYNTNRLIVRGIGSRNPYGSNRVKAYLNEIPLTGGDGITVVEDLAIDELSRIEVLKGPSSALYGAGLGGVVKLTTNNATEEGLNINTINQVGSYGFQKHGISTNYKHSNVAITGFFQRQQSNGYRDNSKYYNNYSLVNGNVSLKQFDIRFTLNHIDLKAHIPSSLDEQTFHENSSNAAENWKAIRGFEKYSKILSGFSISRKFMKSITYKLVLFSGYKDLYESRPFNILEDNTFNIGLRTRLLFDHSTIRTMIGVELYDENISWKTFETLSGEKGSLINDMRESRFYANIFNLNKLAITEKFNIDAGLNLGFIGYRLDKSNNPDYSSDIYNYKPVLSPRAGINYLVNRDLTLYSSVGHGFSAPSFEETLLPDGTKNNNLKPEEGWNFDLGVRGRMLDDRLQLNLAYYTIFAKNLLVTKRISEEIFQGVNAGKTRHEGFEFRSVLYIIDKEMASNKLFLTNSFFISKNIFEDYVDDNIDYSGNKLPGIPKSTSWHKLTWESPISLETSISYSYTGSQFLNDANDVHYNGYQLVNWQLSYSRQISKKEIKAIFTFGIENIFDKKYASMILINAPSFNNNPPRHYYPGMPRNIYVAIKLKL